MFNIAQRLWAYFSLYVVFSLILTDRGCDSGSNKKSPFFFSVSCEMLMTKYIPYKSVLSVKVEMLLRRKISFVCVTQKRERIMFNIFSSNK